MIKWFNRKRHAGTIADNSSNVDTKMSSQPNANTNVISSTGEKSKNLIMNNCSKHKKEVAGIYDMHKLGEMVGDLHYQSLSAFLINLAAKISADAENDKQGGRIKLAKELSDCANSLYAAEQKMLNAWNICKPFMNTENEGQ